MKTEEYLGEEIKTLKSRLRDLESKIISLKIKVEERDEIIKNLKKELGIETIPFEGYVS